MGSVILRFGIIKYLDLWKCLLEPIFRNPGESLGYKTTAAAHMLIPFQMPFSSRKLKEL